MELIWHGLVKAVELLFGFDVEVWSITWRSLRISGYATLISLLIGMPLGIALALARFPGRNATVALINTGMGLPPVVVGLFVSIFLWRSGPLGFLELIYTPAAMILAQVIIAFPIIAGLTMASFQALDPKLASATARHRRLEAAVALDAVQRGQAAALGCRHGRVRRRHLGSRRFDDGGRQYSR